MAEKNLLPSDHRDAQRDWDPLKQWTGGRASNTARPTLRSRHSLAGKYVRVELLVVRVCKP
jgi:hypothetical protein